MRKSLLALFVMLLSMSQVWAEPKGQSEINETELLSALQSSEIAVMQSLLDDNRSKFIAAFKENQSTGRSEWDVAFNGASQELELLEFPLEFYLNVGGARYEEGSGRIVLNSNMSTILFKGGFAHKANVIQKEVIRIRMLQATQTEKQIQQSWYTQVGAALMFLLIVGLTFGLLKELKTIRDIKTGKSDQAARDKICVEVNGILKKFEQNANTLELKFEGKLLKLEQKLVERLKSQNPGQTNGKTAIGPNPLNGTHSKASIIEVPDTETPPKTEASPADNQALSPEAETEPTTTEGLILLEKKEEASSDEDKWQKLLQRHHE